MILPKMTTVDSSMIKAVGYVPERLALYVKFSRGGTYVYLGVMQDAYNDLVGAVSVGGHFHRHFMGVYEAHKCEPEGERI
jgi:hypothetical protein